MTADKRIFHLVHDMAIRGVANAAANPLYAGWKVTFSPPAKTREQEEKAHAMIGDIARQLRLHGKLWDVETIKRLVVDQFRRDTAKDPDLAPLWESMGTMEMMPSLDGTGIVAIGWQTKRFPKALYSAWIEWLLAFGAEHDIEWSNDSPRRRAA